MKKEIADMWCEALRSGMYPQTGGALEDGQGYCCLGVICVVAAQFGLPVAEKSGEIYGGNLDTQLAVKEWAGISHGEGIYSANSHLRSLTTDNDSFGKTFPEIADIIEQHWEEL